MIIQLLQGILENVLTVLERIALILQELERGHENVHALFNLAHEVALLVHSVTCMLL